MEVRTVQKQVCPSLKTNLMIEYLSNVKDVQFLLLSDPAERFSPDKDCFDHSAGVPGHQHAQAGHGSI